MIARTSRVFGTAVLVASLAVGACSSSSSSSETPDGGEAALPPRTTPGEDAGTSDAGEGGATGEGGALGDSGPSIGSCDITAGVGVVLFGPANTTRPDCDAECAKVANHANRACLWNAVDITPRASCHITGASGAVLFGPVDDTQAECATECTTLAPSNPNRSCLWGTTDISPTATCELLQVIGRGGVQVLFGPTATTESVCAAHCTAVVASNPAAVCEWNSTSIR